MLIRSKTILWGVFVCVIVLILLGVKSVSLFVYHNPGKLVIHKTSYDSVYTLLWDDEKQTEEQSCGFACIAFILNRIGFSTSEDELRNTDYMASMQNLADIFHSYKIKTQILDVDSNYFWNHPALSIIHFNFNHFVVFLECRENDCVVFDPSYGQVYIEKKKFYELFDGKILYLYKE